MFLISLGIKGSYFKPCFFEFPGDTILLNEMNILNTHIMLGDSLLSEVDLTLTYELVLELFLGCSVLKSYKSTE